MKQIQYMSVDKVIPYENNPRDNSEAIEYVANSIKEFGFQQPIVVDKDNVIVVGHTRYKSAKSLGLKEVPVIVADELTPKQVKAYRLADNKVGEIATWDIDLLGEEIAELIDNFNMSDFGFDFSVEDEPIEVVEDEAPEVDLENEPTAKLGQIYKLGNHRLMCGDSTNEEDVKKLTNNNNIDLCLTDPPYGIDVVSEDGKVGADFGVAKKGNYSKVIADDTTDTAEKSYEILSRICKKEIIWGGNYFTRFLPFSDGWLIWDKRVNSGIRNTFADGEMAWCSFHTPIRIYHQLWNGMIREGEHDKRVHPTQKPVKMLCEIITDFTKEQDSIIDLFGGSGSTLMACEQLNRNCYMMELDPHYVDVIIKRWETYTGQKAVLVEE